MKPISSGAEVINVAAVMIDPSTRQTVPAMQPHRPLLSLRSEQDPAHVLGHDVIGPMLHAFVQWVRDEAEALRLTCGRPVKVLFLMRDGFLPMKMFEALGSDFAAHEVSISRLTAGRGGLIDTAAVAALIERRVDPTALHRVAVRRARRHAVARAA